MSEQTIATPDAHPSLSKRLSFGLGGLVLIFAFTFAWLYLAGRVLHLHTFYASFVFAWYWGIVDKAEFSRLPWSILGCLLGLAVVWQLSFLSAHYGTAGAVVAVLVIAAVLFMQIMHWGARVINPGTMLFLAVFTATPIMGVVNFMDAGATTVAGALYMAAVIYMLKRVTGIGGAA